MSISGIGVQQILPRTGTTWKRKPSPDRSNEIDNEDAAPAGESERSPPDDGTGKVVDRIV